MTGKKREICLTSVKDNMLTLATFLGVLIGKFTCPALYTLHIVLGGIRL